MVELSEVEILQATGRWRTARTTAVHAGVLLRHYRESANESQMGLAKAVGCDHSFINRIESGQRQLQAHWVPAMAKALRLSPAQQDALLLAGGYAPGGELLDTLAKALAGCENAEWYARGTYLLGLAVAALTGVSR